MHEIRLSARKTTVKPGALVDEVQTILQPDSEVRVISADGNLLCHVVPRALSEKETEVALYPLARATRRKSSNRGYASGTRRVRMPLKDGSRPTISRSRPVASVPAGFFEAADKRTPFCRMTAYAAHEIKAWDAVTSIARQVAQIYKEKEPEFYDWQMRHANLTHPDWLVSGTPYSTVTINVNVRTSAHTDKGDVCGAGRGLSNLLCVTRGEPRGGALCFPEHGIGVQLRDGDLVLMNAHELHANTPLRGGLKSVRGSLVFYLRERLRYCGTTAEEVAKARSVRR